MAEVRLGLGSRCSLEAADQVDVTGAQVNVQAVLAWSVPVERAEQPTFGFPEGSGVQVTGAN